MELANRDATPAAADLASVSKGDQAGRYVAEVSAPGFTSVTVPAGVSAQTIVGWTAELKPSE